MGAPAPAIEGWFTVDPPSLTGSRCTLCGTVVFPPTVSYCRRPGCRGRDFEQVALESTGTVWSYTSAHYQPPPPYVPRTDPFEPFAIAAVTLPESGLVVLGQVADGFGVDDLTIGMPVELVVEPLFADAEREHLVWRWRPVREAR